MGRKSLASLVVAVLLLVFATPPARAEAGLDNFRPINTYMVGQFSDVPAGAWYADNVATAYQLGLMKGSGPSTFNPEGQVTLAESITAAARLHSIYHTGGESFVQGNPWYQVYVDYALINGIIKYGYVDYTAAATRWEFASILANSLPEQDLAPLNDIPDNSLPDVSISASYGPAVYKLYRAGVLTGNNAAGQFGPDTTIGRHAAAAIITRMADPGLRKMFTLASLPPITEPPAEKLTASQVFDQCSPAVFLLLVYDSQNQLYSQGSGFFLNSSGLAATNYHVLEGGSRAEARLSNGQTYAVEGVYDADPDLDLALIKVKGSGFSALLRGDSITPVVGTDCFALGNPQGLTNSISQGIISNPDRYIEGMYYIQFTAAISPGSSGGALLNDQGHVIGVTTSFFLDSQNLNLAVPIHYLNQLNQGSLSTIAKMCPARAGAIPSRYAETNYINLYPGVPFSEYYTAEYEDELLYFHVNNSSVVDCVWGEWYNTGIGSEINLDFHPLSPGKTEVIVWSEMEPDQAVKYNVTVLPYFNQYLYNTNILSYGALTGAVCTATRIRGEWRDGFRTGNAEAYVYPVDWYGAAYYFQYLYYLGFDQYGSSSQEQEELYYYDFFHYNSGISISIAIDWDDDVLMVILY